MWEKNIERFNAAAAAAAAGVVVVFVAEAFFISITSICDCGLIRQKWHFQSAESNIITVDSTLKTCKKHWKWAHKWQKKIIPDVTSSAQKKKRESQHLCYGLDNGKIRRKKLLQQITNKLCKAVEMWIQIYQRMKCMSPAYIRCLCVCAYENVQFQFSILQLYRSHTHLSRTQFTITPCDLLEWKLNYPSNLNGIMNTLIQIQLLPNDFPFLTIISRIADRRREGNQLIPILMIVLKWREWL